MIAPSSSRSVLTECKIDRGDCKFFLQSGVRGEILIGLGSVGFGRSYKRIAGERMVDSSGPRARTDARFAVPALIVAVLAWLWPIGIGGGMPVGGDVTHFSIGLMAELGRSIRAGRLPIWNDLWGYGFPGIGESQMGVYYPPHMLLYGLFGPEYAYTWSLVLHTIWGSLGAYWAARRFGVSAVGAALSGFSWSTCGFFLIHLPHQWGYTTGCWMPWAWGLAWSIMREDGRRRDPFVLAAVLAIQLLPGHFQLAFCTQGGIVVLALARGAELLALRSRGLARVMATLLTLAWAFPLAALQLWPTLRLARLAAPRRDFEYLSGFAATPLHLMTFLTPGLFGRSPLWRLLVWDPFHTSPEEYLGYVGLIPLFLSLGAVAAGVRGSSAVRALSAVVLVTMILALGPYVPGFRYWCGLPGFAFFRAPARWMLATCLGLSILAGIGFDGLETWQRPGRAIVRFVIIGLIFPALVLVAIELALTSTERTGRPAIASFYSRVMDRLPWHESRIFEGIVSSARQPFLDPRVNETWARQGVALISAPKPVFIDQRWSIYRKELAGSAVLFALLLGLAPIAGNRRILQSALICITFIDLWMLGRDRRIDVGPLVPLSSQSPVLARLAASPRGTRTIDGLDNLPIVTAVNPVHAYRTLDLPALDSLTRLANQIPAGPGELELIRGAIHLVGADLRVFDPSTVTLLEERAVTWRGLENAEEFYDPALAGWLHGTDFVAQQGASVSHFRILELPGPRVRGWLVPLTLTSSAAILGTWSGNPLAVLAAMNDARPVEVRSADPEHRVASIHTNGPALLILSQLADPQWEAVWVSANGEQKSEPLRAFGRPGEGAWQAVRVPARGDWTLRLVYRGRDVYQGLACSAIAWSVFGAAFLAFGRERSPHPTSGAESA